MKKLYLILLGMLFLAAPLQAVFYQIEIYKNPEGTICCLISDEHVQIENEKAGQEHLDEFVQFIKKYKNKAHIFIEANDRHRRYGIERQKETVSIGQENFLLLFARALESKEVYITNVDHRNGVKIASSFKDGSTVIDCINNTPMALNNLIAHKESLPRDSLITKYYDTILKKSKNILKQFKDETIVHYQSQDEHHNHEYLKFDAALVDATIVCDLTRNSDAELIFVCAGRSHIYNVVNTLKKFSWSPLGSIRKKVTYVDTFAEVPCLKESSLLNAQKAEEMLNKIMRESMKPNQDLKFKRRLPVSLALETDNSAAGETAINVGATKKQKREDNQSPHSSSSAEIVAPVSHAIEQVAVVVPEQASKAMLSANPLEKLKNFAYVSLNANIQALHVTRQKLGTNPTIASTHLG